MGRSANGVSGLFTAALLALGAWGGGGEAHATLVDITDRNSRLLVETSTQAGNFAWLVDGTPQLAKQWFWYRIGNDAEQSIDALVQTGFGLGKDPLTNPGDNNFAVEYRDAQNRFSITLSMTLTGGDVGSGTSHISEVIQIKNLTASALDFHFFQFVDLDLNGTVSDTSVEITGTNLNTAQQHDGITSVAETVVTPAPSHRQAGFFENILPLLNDALPTTLNDSVGPVGPGDLAWAFQWDFTLGGNRSYLISKEKEVVTTSTTIIPEPTTVLMLLGGGAALLRRRGG